MGGAECAALFVVRGKFARKLNVAVRFGSEEDGLSGKQRERHVAVQGEVGGAERAPHFVVG